MATLSIKDEQLFQIKAHMAMLGIKKYSVWIDYILDNYGVYSNKTTQKDILKILGDKKKIPTPYVKTYDKYIKKDDGYDAKAHEAMYP